MAIIVVYAGLLPEVTWPSLALCAIALCALLLPERDLEGRPAILERAASLRSNHTVRSAALGVVALLAWGGALWAFGAGGSAGTAGWVLYGIALVCGFAAFRAGERMDATSRWTAGEALALLGALAVGALFRFHLLGREPHGAWFDEAENCLVALRILDDPAYRPVFVAGFSQMPALFFYLIAAAIKVVGPTVLAARLISTIGGLASIVVTYLLGRELFDRRVAAFGALFLAVMRWHIAFSRFGMTILFPSLFIPLSLLFLARAIARGRISLAVASGFSLAVGLQFYYAMFGIPILLVLVCLHAGWRRELPHAYSVAVMLSLVFAYAPIVQYAHSNWSAFHERVGAVSGLSIPPDRDPVTFLTTASPERTGLFRNLGHSAAAHLGMFHLQGDLNGRHNAPGMPMLDRVTGLFFAAGILACLLRAFDVRYSMLLLWVGASLSGGVLSLANEAPHAGRTCGLTSAIALIAALQCARLLASGRAAGAPRIAVLVSGGLIATAALTNWRDYFRYQLNDPEVWKAFSPAETKIGEIVRAEGAEAEIFAPRRLVGQPTTELLSGRKDEPKLLIEPSELEPILAAKKVIVVGTGSEHGVRESLLGHHPAAASETLTPPGSDEEILWIVRIPAGANTIGEVMNPAETELGR